MGRTASSEAVELASKLITLATVIAVCAAAGIIFVRLAGPLEFQLSRIADDLKFPPEFTLIDNKSTGGFFTVDQDTLVVWRVYASTDEVQATIDIVVATLTAAHYYCGPEKLPQGLKPEQHSDLCPRFESKRPYYWRRANSDVIARFNIGDINSFPVYAYNVTRNPAWRSYVSLSFYGE